MGRFVSAKWRITTLLARLFLRWQGRNVHVGKRIKFLGLPIVSGTRYGSIAIGDNSVLVSDSRGTALGVRSPVIIRLMHNAAQIKIGADCGLSGSVICAAKSIIIGDRCLIGADVMIFDTDFHNKAVEGRRYAKPVWENISEPVSIGSDVFIGTRVIITKGVTIGEGSIIAAGSVVVTNVPPHTIFGGNPARQIGKIEENMREVGSK